MHGAANLRFFDSALKVERWSWRNRCLIDMNCGDYYLTRIFLYRRVRAQR